MIDVVTGLACVSLGALFGFIVGVIVAGDRQDEVVVVHEVDAEIEGDEWKRGERPYGDPV